MMRSRRRGALMLALGATALAGCDDVSTGIQDDLDPRNLEAGYTWELDSWQDGTAVGQWKVDLRWEVPLGYDEEVFRVYARNSRSGGYDLIATVTSCLEGVCYYGDLNVEEGESYDYYVVTVDDWDGDEIGSSRDVTVRIPSSEAVSVPGAPAAIALDGAVFLEWTATGAQVYMILGQEEGGEIFVLGETDGTSFLDDRAENGVRYRYYLAGRDEESRVSGLSSAATAVPRPDYHTEVLYALADDASRSGFRFVGSDASNPVSSGTAPNAQWRLESTEGGLVIQPLGSTRIDNGIFSTQLTCGPGSEDDCVDVQAAPPEAQLGTSAVTVVTGYTYVLRVTGDDNRTHFAKVRVQGDAVDAEGRRLIIFDWAYQLRPDEPSLLRAGG